jgi:hypothetical protein
MTPRPRDVTVMRQHAAKLLHEVANAMQKGKVCPTYIDRLKEANRTVSKIAACEVVIASTAQAQADEVAR